MWVSYTSKPGATVAIFPYGTTMGYVEVCFPNISIIPGSTTICYVESQIALGLRTGLSSSLFNYTNDWSYYKAPGQALSSTAETKRVAVLSNGQLTCGELPALVPSTINNLTSSINNQFNNYTKAKIYPNPAKDLFYVELNKSVTNPVQFTLIDLSGRPVLKRTFQNATTHTFQIPLSLQSKSGFYIWEIRMNNGQLFDSGKIWIQ
ncbi:MAG: T9SS type A sorting domain-containing protein [Chitinophagaceae bacterium]